MRDLNPVQWAVLPLRKYADFSGRAPRAEYWWFYLGSVAISFVLAIIDNAVGTNDLIGTIFSIAVFVPSMAVTVRRLHDIDRTGYWLFAFIASFAVIGLIAVFAGGAGQAPGSVTGMFTVMIVAVVGIVAVGITMLVFMVQAGTDGANRYGDDPYGPGNLEQVFA